MSKLTGVITGSGTYALPGLEAASPERVDTPYGPSDVTRGRLANADVIHVSRHGPGHARLSNHVNHRANVAALCELDVSCILAFTVAGGVDPELELGELVVFDDLHFPGNRLPDGSLCTFHAAPDDPERAHWIFERPFSDGLRSAVVEGSRRAGARVRDGGCYGHVDGPRFNTATEIRALAACGVTAISQTAGPETVLAGEAAIPVALVSYITDHANGVKPAPTPIEELATLLDRSKSTFASVLAETLPLLGDVTLEPSGVVFRMKREER